MTLPPAGSAIFGRRVMVFPPFDPNQGSFIFVVSGAMFKATNFVGTDDFALHLELVNNVGGTLGEVQANAMLAGAYGTLYPNFGSNVDHLFTVALVDLPLTLEFRVEDTLGAGGDFSWDSIAGYMLAVTP